MAEDNERLDTAIELLKEPVKIDPAFDQRVMAEIQSGPSPSTWAGVFWRALAWLRSPRTVTVSPLGGLGFATAVLVIAFVGRELASGNQPELPEVTMVQGSVVQFVIVAPSASDVALVGDFNDWNASATPLEVAADDRVWSVTVPLEAGRYRYAFLVDGETWLSDPSAPPARDDDFGRPGSVVTIGET